ncbi:hypothetical protein SAMN05421579_1637 [Xenorhabdus japonica]|uniref:Phage integrase family protein n=1 Tax=Xenorhabdus japonica TaxID=53341 RepID=A0A1I5EE04_9GAMM|nr:hypothetical protein SAMN05421579_1637 [Xenorhabdus japonica]
MAKDSIQTNPHHTCCRPTSRSIHGHIDNLLMCTGTTSGISEFPLPRMTAGLAKITLMTRARAPITVDPLLGHKSQAMTDKYHDDRGKDWTIFAVK